MTIKTLTIGYLVDFMEHIRPEDLEEVEVGEGRPLRDTPVAALLKSGCLCLVDDETDEVYALGGCADNIIWMLCITRVETNKISFLRYTKATLKELLQSVPYYLYNAVYKKNTLHVKWLKWMGAKFIKETETETHIAFMFEGRKELDNV